jgi:RNA polymerase sigma-70 factor (ECF subfamily)
MSAGQTEMWVTAASGGDQLALAKLLAMYHPMLAQRVAGRLEPSLRARLSPDDVLQEVYLQVFRQVSGFEARAPQSFLNWVLTILDHKLVDLHRSAHREQRDIDRESPAVGGATNSYWNLLDHVYRDSTTPSRVVRRDEAISALAACIGELSAAHRQIIELRFLTGMSVAEIAQRLGKSEDAVVALTQRALKALRDAMTARGEHTTF